MKPKATKIINSYYVDITLPTQNRMVFVGDKPYYLRFPQYKIQLRVERFKKRYRLIEFLFQKSKGDWYPPFINVSVFENYAALCMGKAMSATSITQLTKNALERFYVARWEGALYGTQFFRLQANAQKGKTPKPKPIDWKYLEQFDAKEKANGHGISGK